MLSGSAKVGKITLAKNMPVTATGDYDPEEQITIALEQKTMNALCSGKDENGNEVKPVVLIQPEENQVLAENLEDKIIIDKNIGSIRIKRDEVAGTIIAYFHQTNGIYLDGVNGNDEPEDGNDDSELGLVPEKPVKTFTKAKELLKTQYESFKNGTLTEKPDGIYVMGTVTVDDEQTWSLEGMEGMSLIRYYPGSFDDAMAEVSGTLTLENITLDGWGKMLTAKEALIKVDGGTLNIHNGAVLQNNNHTGVDTESYTAAGGAVYGRNNATINMSGGKITGNTSWMGGGIQLYASKLTMSGGEITGNRVIYGGRASSPDSIVGGGVAVLLDSTFNLSGGTISNNSAPNGGGGIALGGMESTSVWQEGHESPRLYMTGGTISGNTSNEEGGGIYVQSSATATIDGGFITGNHSLNGQFGGGGIYVNAARPDSGINTDGTLNLHNVIITGNSAEIKGSGLAACATSTTEIYLTDGGAIYGNSQNEQVFIDHGGLESGTFISSNSGKSIGTISEFMLGGGAYNWTNAITGEPMASDVMAAVMGDRHLNNAPTEEGISAASAKATVWITGNTAATRGGGIGSNGTVIIGTSDDNVIDIPVTKKWTNEDENNKDNDGNYLTRPESVRIWLLRYDKRKPEQEPERVSSLVFNDRKALSEKRIFKNLPADPSYIYTLEEEITTDGACYESTILKISHANGTYEFEVTNRLMNDLLIKKEVSGISVNTPFTFKIEIELKDGTKLNGSLTAKQNNGKDITETPIEFKDGKAQVQLKHGETVQLMNLPAGAKYKVTEQTESGYTTSVTTTINGKAGEKADGTVAEGNIQTGLTELAYKNTHYDEPKNITGSAQIQITKLLEGREWLEDDKFEIQLTEISEDAEADRLTTPLCKTVSVDKHSVSFQLDYTKPGRHVYQVEELVGSVDGITYDQNKYTVTVDIKDNGGDKLQTSVMYPSGQTEITFTNKYQANGDVVLEAEKHLTGRTLKNNEFTFGIYEIEVDEAGNTTETSPMYASNDAEGNVVFPALNYTQKDIGVHHYKIVEIKGNDANITYSTQIFEAIVTVTDEGKDKLGTTVSYPQGKPVFENQYHASGLLTLEGNKRLTGGRKNPMADNEFSFQVTENGKEVATGKSKADGSIAFTEILYSAQDIGTHVYEIREIKGTDKNIVYSADIITVTVEVTDQGNGVLDVKASYPAGGITFENKYTETPSSVVVTKRLINNGSALSAVNQTFYVALYHDEACTKPASGVQPLIFKNVSSSTVTFDGLEPGKTYYVGETDENGTLIQSGVLSNGELFQAVFPNGNKVQTGVNGEKAELYFDNTFPVVPEGFYKGAELTITKKLVSSDETPLNSESTFYAGIFADKNHTILSEIVSENIVALHLNGGSEASEVIHVSLDDGDTQTLYVTEVDENGYPVADASDFEYEVSADKTSVTLSPENLHDSVTITNKEQEEIETEFESETEKTPKKPAKSVKTEDETPVVGYLLILLSAAMTLITLIFGRKRIKK